MKLRPKTLYVKMTAGSIIGGTQHWPGEVLEVSPDIYRELIREGLAVPHVGRGHNSMATSLDNQKIRPYYGDQEC